MKKFKFLATLKRPDGVGTWHYVDTPLDTAKEFNIKGKVPIYGQINRINFSTSLIPRGNGEHYIVLDKKIRVSAGINLGDLMSVSIWKDNTERTVDVPKDLQLALLTNQEVFAYFNDLAISHKKAYVHWINAAKKDVTRENRIAKAIDLLNSKNKLK